MPGVDRKWWKDAVVYQIWPASYKDSNGDGIGDIPGIISTLDYIKELGTDVIWLSPSYKSPQKDMGYDISDYEDIDPQYGTLADAEKLIKEVHARGMKIIFDLVINHTSDQHRWFQESRSSKDNPKRDWYIWRPARYDAEGKRQPPSNWRSFLTPGSTWEWDETTQEYYLHLFVPEQPDLNWENEECRRAIYDSAIKFWLERGIDGFRIDTVNMYSKPTEFQDGPIRDRSSEFQVYPEGFINGPRMHEFLSEIYEVMAPYDTMTVGELSHTPDVETVRSYVSAAAKQMDMVFEFDVASVGRDNYAKFATFPYALSEFKTAYVATQRLAADRRTDAWGTAFLENHDLPRSVSRFATDDPKHLARAAKLLAALLAASSGTLFLYQGQELGMHNFPRSWGPEDYRDVDPVLCFAEAAARGQTDELERLLDGAQKIARDHARTPVQWTPGPNAGFCAQGVKPWMRVNDDWRDVNAQNQAGDRSSVLGFWKEAIAFRKANAAACVYGAFEPLQAGGEQAFCFVKDPEEDGGPRLVAALNFTAQRLAVAGLEEEAGARLGELLLCNVPEGERGGQEEAGKIVLQPWEARVYALESK